MRPNHLIRLWTTLLLAVVTATYATDLTEAELARLTPAQKKRLEKTAEREEKYTALVDEGKVAECLPVVEKILADYEAVIGKEHPLTSQWVYELALVHVELEQYREARPIFERALVAQRKNPGPEHDETIETLHGLSNLQLTLGEYSAARKSLDEVLRVRLKVHGEKAELTADTFNDLGLWADSTGDFTRAIEAYRRALKIYEELHGEEHEGTAAVLGNLALALWTAGDYLAARDLQEKALAIRRKLLGDENFDTAMSLNNLGLVERDLGDYALAKKHFEEGRKIAAATVGEKHAKYGMCLANLSTVLVLQEDLAGALTLAEQALAIQEEVYGKDHNETLVALTSLILLKAKTNDFAAAEAYLERGRKIADAAFGADSTTSMSLQSMQAGLFYLQGRAADAEPLYRQVYENYRDRYGDEQFDTALARGDWALAQAIGGERADALAQFDAARRAVRRIALQILPGLPDRQVLQCLKEKDQEFQHTVLSLGLRFQDDPAWREHSATWLLNAKATAQEVLAQQTLLAREANDPAVAEVVRELLSVRRRLAALSVLKPGQEESAEHEREIESLQGRERELMKQIAAHDRGKSRAVREESKTWTELAAFRAKLPADGVFVNFARLRTVNFKPTSYDDRFGDERYVAWVIPAAGEVRVIDLGPALEIDQRLQAARDAMQQAVAAEKTLEPLRELAARVLHPLLPHVGAAKSLILSPDSALWLAPWQALPLPDGAFTIEKFRLRFLLSGRELTAASEPVAKNPARIFADPNYDLSAESVEASLKAVFREKYQPPTDDGGNVRSFAAGSALQATRLPGTAVEARAIQPALDALTKLKTTVYADQYALEGVFKKMSLTPRILVLSTHGYFQADQTTAGATSGKAWQNPLLRCGLLLAGCNQPRTDGGDDGVLTGLEILGVDLRGTELVVLSACETGLGKVNDGDGVAGLRQAFQLAGAKAVVASLWQVPDRDSALLMNDFFAELAAGKAKDEALRVAQIKRITARRERFGAAHPFFWAAWTVTGE